MSPKSSGNETEFTAKSDGQTPGIAVESADGEEQVALALGDHGPYTELSGPGGVFGVLVPTAWAATAVRWYDDDGAAIYQLTSAPDIEAFEDSYTDPGVTVGALPMFDGYVCTRRSIDAVMDTVSPAAPEQDPGRTYETTGIIRTKTHLGFESWQTDGGDLQIMAGASQNRRWLYLLLIQGIDLDRQTSRGEVVDDRTHTKITSSLFGHYYH